jgi:chemotaxis protein MotB
MSGSGGADSRWLITYGDLVTLLMAFFIALYGISHADKAKFDSFLKGLGPFGNPAAANSGILKGGPSIVGSGTGVGSAQAGTTPAAKSGGTPSNGPAAGAVRATQSDLPAVAAQIHQALEARGLGGAVTFTVESRGLVATIATDHVLFDTGSTRVSAAGQQIIAAIAPTLSGISNRVLVEGHTDNVPLNQNGYTNWNLSTDRAVAVLQILQGSFGIDPARLSGAGYGEYHPVASDATAQGRAANRRVEVVVLTDAPAQSTAQSAATATATPAATPTPAKP